MSVVARRYFKRGCDFLEDGDLGSAIEQLRSAVELAPSFAEGRLALAAALARLGDRMSAAQVLQVGLSRIKSPVSRARLSALLADILIGAGDHEGAETALQSAESEPSLEPRVAAARARMCVRRGDYAGGLAQWARVLKAST